MRGASLAGCVKASNAVARPAMPRCTPIKYNQMTPVQHDVGK